ncbi:MAG: enoyl-CoA hydratase/isomerase family protein [Acidobacteria bacterium]|nr:enoyl-CoA hydratase/isomerase family protein [Acidobacteriota bacterium]
MKWNVQRAVVLGAGTMGSRIAAHLANCGIPCYLLDLVPTELTPEEKKKGLSLNASSVRNRIAQTGLQAALKGKPAAFFLEEQSSHVTVGNFDDHLGWIGEADWVIEAVAEDLEIKRNLLGRIVALRRPGTVVSTNSSGLSVERMASEFPPEFRRHWLGTHFFNPPRYLHLLEVIPGPDTLPEVVQAVSEFADLRLGKGVVRAKDTPGFIANRIGTFAICHILRVMQEEGLQVEEVDALTGPLIGWPKSATCGMLDLVGLDILAVTTRHLRSSLPQDESREVFTLPELVEKMLAQGLLGAKTGSGFYKQVRQPSGATEKLVLDPQTLEYRPWQNARLAELDKLQGVESKERIFPLWQLAQSEDRAGRFVWKALSRLLLYTARRTPEIAESITDVDQAMRWGFGWELGPFELWDALGLEPSVRRMERDGSAIPENIVRMLSAGRRRFYEPSDGTPRYFDFSRERYQPVEARPGILLLRGGPHTPPVIRQSAEASLRDLGDGAACVEFHGKANSIGPDTVKMIHGGLQELGKNFDALVIANQGKDFCAGANLALLLEMIEAQNWEAVDQMVRRFQQTMLAMKYATKPVVAAPFRFTLGGGCEVALAAVRVQAAAETYMGLDETGVGLVPAGGGAKEMLLRATDSLPERAELIHAVREVFEIIGYAKVSGSTEEARQMRFLQEGDGITMNPDRLLADAKQTALEMARAGYHPAQIGPRTGIRVVGENGLAELKVWIHNARRGGWITDHDAMVTTKLAEILCGGRITGPATVSEQYLLDLEREAFLSLCGEPNTQTRIKAMHETGKPLRN